VRAVATMTASGMIPPEENDGSGTLVREGDRAPMA